MYRMLILHQLIRSQYFTIVCFFCQVKIRKFHLILLSFKAQSKFVLSLTYTPPLNVLIYNKHASSPLAF